MGNFITEMENLQLEAEGLTGICQAFVEAMAHSPNQTGDYSAGLSLLSSFMQEHATKMEKAIIAAVEERGVNHE